ncbi:MAG: S8 family serine peptidase [Nitriliruptorales bacterium]|nr:S8 family serine peptidase [Nitriliruptorales bacterium]
MDRVPERLSQRAVDGFQPGALRAEVVVFVRLSEPSVAELVTSLGGTASPRVRAAQARRIEQQQARASRELSRLGAEEIYRLRVSANGLAVRMAAEDIASVREMSEVRSVAAIAQHELTNATSVPWIGTPSVWQDLGLTGEDISVAVIDTGIDYYHADFGGTGDPADYENDDPTTVEAGTFPTAKVVGGYDFVGDDYDASGETGSETPVADDDPLDCHGHGTHVAGTAAGQGVLADGTTYTGPYDATTHANDFEVGPGVAPQADLYALKVFGCSGSTAVTAMAIEWAMDPDGDPATDDHLDVINMSLGSIFGHPDEPTSITATNAAAAGVVVVASAGNSGDVAYVTGSPAAGEGVISVAASIDGGYQVHALEVTIDGGTEQLLEAGLAGFGPDLAEVGPVVGALATTTPVEGCEPIAEDLTDQIALISRGSCEFSTKVLNAQNANAIGAVIYNNTGGDEVIDMGAGEVADQVEIPSMFISQNDGGTLVEALGNGSTVVATLSADIVIPKPELADHLTGFTSRGPGGGDTFKPDLSAPGQSIDSADAGSGDSGALASGTSMASPHVAGMAALLREQHADLDVAAIKSVLMNSTEPTAITYPIARQGVGVARMDAAAALDAYTSPAGVTFGRLNPLEPHTETRTVTVTDMSGDARTYSIDVEMIQTPPGVTFTAPDEVMVPANGTAEIELELELDPAAMAADNAFYSQTEIDGRITLSHGDAELAVGFLGVVDPASDVVASVNRKGKKLTLTNDSDTVGTVDTFTHTGDGIGSVAEVGVRTRELFGIDVVEFGIANATAWDSLSIWETDILLDTNQDGSWDYALVAVDLGLILGGDPTGQVVTALFDLVNGGGFLEWYVTADLNDRVQTLTVDRQGTFGFLASGDVTFDYLVVSYDLRNDAPAGLASGSVHLAKQADGRANFSTYLAPGEQVTMPMAADSRLLMLYQNNQVGSQHETAALSPSRGGQVGRPR